MIDTIEINPDILDRDESMALAEWINALETRPTQIALNPIAITPKAVSYDAICYTGTEHLDAETPGGEGICIRDHELLALPTTTPRGRVPDNIWGILTTNAIHTDYLVESIEALLPHG